MSKKKIDIRVEILSYLDEKKQKQYYPAIGFPVEVFVINENAKIAIFTHEILNSSNFYFLSNISSRRGLSASLKKMLFLGNYILYDSLCWNFVDEIKKPNNNINNYLCLCSIFLSQFTDIKLIQLENALVSKKVNTKTLSTIYKNSSWLERENSEMFSLSYLNLKDTRKLLLDYSSNSGVMLKNSYQNNLSNYFKNYYGVNFYNNI